MELSGLEAAEAAAGIADPAYEPADFGPMRRALEASAGALATPGGRTVEALAMAAPLELALSTPRPNPTRRSATITLTLPEPAGVRLEVYDTLGRLVAVVAEGWQEAGASSYPIDAARLAAGVYIVHAVVSGPDEMQRQLTQRMSVLE